MTNNMKRNSKIEILRAISMLFIIMSHYSSHGGIDISKLPFGFVRIFLEITVLGNLGVNLFILITGYYSKSEKHSLEKIIKFILQISFYSILIYIILLLWGKIKFNWLEMFKAFFPITFNQYWFATAYFVLLLLSPFINKFLNRVTKKEHFNFIFVMLVLFSICRTFTTQDFFGNELIHFIMIYSIGSYISRYKIKLNIKNNIITIIFISILLILITIIVDRMCNYYNLDFAYVKYFLSKQSFFIVILSISIFEIFLKNPFENKFINYFSPSIFGIYLIHDNEYLKNVIWGGILKNQLYSTSNFFIIHWVISIIMIFGCCLFIDMIRRKCIEEKIMSKLKKIITFLEKIIKKLTLKIFNILN